jgi:hypothetical protein
MKMRRISGKYPIMNLQNFYSSVKQECARLLLICETMEDNEGLAAFLPAERGKFTKNMKIRRNFHSGRRSYSVRRDFYAFRSALRGDCRGFSA